MVYTYYKGVYNVDMNEITFSTYGNKQYMKEDTAKASYGWFYVVGNRVEYYVAGMSYSDAENAYCDDLIELKNGNVDFKAE